MHLFLIYSFIIQTKLAFEEDILIKSDIREYLNASEEWSISEENLLNLHILNINGI